MTLYLTSFFVGILVGGIYASLKVQSPAPPIFALIGLFGILIGEHSFPVIKEKLFPAAITKEKKNV